MKNEKIIIVPNGINNDFYADLISQAESDIENAMIEQHMENSMIEDSMIEQHMEDSMIEQHIEDSMIEDAMIEQYMEDSMIEQYMEDSMIEQHIEDSMIEQYIGSSSIPDKKVDSWIAVYTDFSTKTSENASTLSKNNLLCFIHKKFERISKTGKTSYFSYHIVDENLQNTQLQIGNYLCKLAESEHWVGWDYENTQIKEQHYLTFFHQNNSNFKYERTFFYPLDYNFASIIPLHKYNPFSFSFKKLNFLNKNSISSCGDKFARIVILDAKNRFLEITIYDFGNNIIPLLRELNDSVSFIDFVLKIHLKYAGKYLGKIKKDLQKKPNNFIKVGFDNIKKDIDKMLEQNSKFLPYSVKNNLNSEVNLLMKQYEILIIEITKLI